MNHLLIIFYTENHAPMKSLFQLSICNELHLPSKKHYCLSQELISYSCASFVFNTLKILRKHCKPVNPLHCQIRQVLRQNNFLPNLFPPRVHWNHRVGLESNTRSLNPGAHLVHCILTMSRINVLDWVYCIQLRVTLKQSGTCQGNLIQ